MSCGVVLSVFQPQATEIRDPINADVRLILWPADSVWSNPQPGSTQNWICEKQLCNSQLFLSCYSQADASSLTGVAHKVWGGHAWLLNEAWLHVSGLDTLHRALVFLEFLVQALDGVNVPQCQCAWIGPTADSSHRLAATHS